MKLRASFLRLPLRFDAERLAAEVAAIPDSVWRKHPQKFEGNSALPLVSVGGDVGSDALRGPMLPTPYLADLPYLTQVMASLGTVVGRTRLMRLAPGAEAPSHTDVNYYWQERVRVHVPIVTHPDVAFHCGPDRVHMAAGTCWIFNTWLHHRVENATDVSRVHLVVDTVGSRYFWELADRAHVCSEAAPNAEADPALDRLVAYRPGDRPELATEAVNVPSIMSPWEVSHLVRYVVEDIATTDRTSELMADDAKAQLRAFEREWTALWARFGPDEAHRSTYQRVADELVRSLEVTGNKVNLTTGMGLLSVVRQVLAEPALGHSPFGGTMASPAPTASVGAPVVAAPRPAGPTFDRPIFVVSSPRSGSSLLFETLARAPGLHTLGGENHAVFEGIAALDPRRRGYDSNRQTAADADAATAEALRAAYRAELRDRDGRPVPAGASTVRMLEKTPKNSLRVPFLDAVFDGARFVYLYRSARETISSMLDAWRSGRFVTYPELPGWSGPPWSLLLVPGWRDLDGRPIAEVAARQWAIATELLLDDLSRIAPERCAVVRYDALVDDPQGTMERLARRLGLGWDTTLDSALPLSRHTLTPPEKDKWRKNEAELEGVLALVAETERKAEALVERLEAAERAAPAAPEAPSPGPSRAIDVGRPAPRVEAPRAPDAPGATATAAQLRSVHTQNMPAIFAQLGISLLVSTYQSGHLIAVRADGDKLNTHFRTFRSPMGIAIGANGFALGTHDALWVYRNQPSVAPRVQPPKPYDACFLPQACHVTGDIRIHDVAYGAQDLWIVNTKFSCLSTLDREHSFVPRWRPPFVSGLAAEDRCHLNGLAMVDGQPRYVTALGTTDTAGGWRANRAHGGVILEVPSGRVVAKGLSMPHSPRVYRGALWFLESGDGSLARVDVATGEVTTVARLPGFTRGLAFAGPVAFVGLSQVRETNIFGGIPLTERVKERVCGVWAVNVETSQVLGFLRFEGQVHEIFDVQAIRAKMPEIVEVGSEIAASSFVVPQQVMRDVRTTPA